MDSLKIVRIISVFIVVLIVGTVARIMFANSPQKKTREINQKIDQVKEVIVEKINTCKPVLDSCEIELSRKEDNCKPEAIISALKKDLLNSMSFKNCSDLLDDMKTHCQKGCQPELASLVKVDSKPKVDINYYETNTGKELIFHNSVKTNNLTCEIKASKFVNLRLECR